MNFLQKFFLVLIGAAIIFFGGNVDRDYLETWL